MTPTERAAVAEAIAALDGMLAEWDKITRYGSPFAKSANENVNRARKTIASLRAVAPAPADQSDSTQVALWMMSNGYATGHGDTIPDMLVELEGQAKERALRTKG